MLLLLPDWPIGLQVGRLLADLLGDRRGGRRSPSPSSAPAVCRSSTSQSPATVSWPTPGQTTPGVLSFAQQRLEGARQACAELGLPAPVVRAVPIDPRGAARAIQAWRGADPPVTAVCAYNDEVAFAVLAGARDLGLLVPADLAVIGVDDLPVAAVAAPPLSTIHVDVPALAQYVADSIVSKLYQRPTPLHPASAIHDVIARESA